MSRPRLDARGVAGLIRPRIAGLVMVVAAVGFLLEHPASYRPLPWLLLGTLLVAAAGCSLNHFLEREADAAMRRTRYRPLVTGALTPRQVSWGGGITLVAGLAVLWIGTTPLATGLELLASVIYLCIYTPLKKRTSSNTWVGAMPGALPLLVGAAAARPPSLLAFLAFALLFLWQLPHFFAIASMYREDYVSGGMRMLSGEDPDDALLRWQMPLQVMSVMLLSLVPPLLDLAGTTYALVAVGVGALFLASAFAFRSHPDRARARRVVLASVAYLPLVLGALVVDVACGSRSDDGASSTTSVAKGQAACEACEDPATGLAAGSTIGMGAESGADVGAGPVAAGTEQANASSPGHRVAADLGQGAEADDAADELLARLSALGGDTPPPTIEDGTGLPDYGELPDFHLVGDDSQPFAKADLLGTVWVVDFIFTSCAGPCPIMSQVFVEQAAKGTAARFLSITVDPRRDGPRQLAAYREQQGGQAERWRLLTGEAGAIQALAEGGFHLPVNAGAEPVAGMGPMFHSGKFALVDAGGHVRGYYDYRDRLSLEQMRADAAALTAAAKGS